MGYDCQSCGACCSYKTSWPVLRRDRSDAKNIPEYLVRSDLPLMKTLPQSCRCIALEGVVGNNTSCAIYKDRPQACARFVPGSPLCLEARKHFNLPIEK